jgi:Protein of unknown function (DUF4240)
MTEDRERFWQLIERASRLDDVAIGPYGRSIVSTLIDRGAEDCLAFAATLTELLDELVDPRLVAIAERAGYDRDEEGVLALRCRIIESGAERHAAFASDPEIAEVPAPRAIGRFDLLELAAQAHAVVTGDELPPIDCRLFA